MAKGRIRSAIKKRIKTPTKGARRLKAATKAVTKSVTKSAAAKVMRAFENFDADRKLLQYKIREFKPKVRIRFEKGDFTVKTLENGEELEAALRLRFRVFHKEFQNRRRSSGVDVDKLDFIADHLAIIDNRKNEIVGTYRLNSSKFSDTFYASTEFEIDKALALPGNKLELGRACIDKEYRTGSVITLLWRGIAEYISKTETEIIIGCASVQTMDPLEIGLVTHHLAQLKALHYDYDIEPTKKYKVKTLGKVLDYIDKNPYEYNAEKVDAILPSLFSSYIKMGLRAYGEPALDRDFKCIDYFIMMKTSDMNEAFRRRYMRDV